MSNFFSAVAPRFVLFSAPFHWLHFFLHFLFLTCNILSYFTFTQTLMYFHWNQRNIQHSILQWHFNSRLHQKLGKIRSMLCWRNSNNGTQKKDCGNLFCDEHLLHLLEPNTGENGDGEGMSELLGKLSTLQHSHISQPGKKREKRINLQIER